MKRICISALILLSSLNFISIGYATDGFPGHCLNFPSDGQPGIRVWDPPTQVLYQDFTMMGWFRAPMQTQWYDGTILCADRGSSPETGPSFALTLRQWDGSLVFNDYSSFPGGGIIAWPLCDLEWHHFALSGSWGYGGAFDLWVDGIHAGSRLYPPNWSEPDQLCFGQTISDYSDLSRWLEGELDELSLWSQVLSGTEIRERMHPTLTGDEENLVAYWQCNDGSGMVLSDALGNYPGTLQGGAGWDVSWAPVGGGTSQVHMVFYGLNEFGDTGLSLDYTEVPWPGPDEVGVTRLDLSPNLVPPELEVFDQQYWIIERYEDDDEFSADLQVTLGEDLTDLDESSPSRIQLLHRNSNSTGDWSFTSFASSVDATIETATFPGLQDFSQFLVVRDPQPRLVATGPADDAVEFPVSGSLQLEFNQPILAGPGSLQLYRTEGDLLVTNLPASGMSIDGMLVTAELDVVLELETDYYVLVDADAFQADGEYFFAGIMEPTTWNFTTLSHFTSWSTLPASGSSSSAWGDYDNDGDLDILCVGNPTVIYRNDGGSFTNVGGGLPGVTYPSAAWGDFDTDGDLDILLSGQLGGGQITRVYRNDAGNFSDISADLPGVADGSAEWGDYDNDGDLDILLTGTSGSTGLSGIYRNDDGNFTDIGAGLTASDLSSAAWGDYDNDGDLDILLTGYGVILWHIFRNDGGNFTPVNIGWSNYIYGGSVRWGDYDNDGDLDILLTGSWGINNPVSRIYRNTVGSFADIGAGLTGVFKSSAEWGDCDNDGDLDILLTGDTGSGDISRIYRNDEGSFTDVGADLPGVEYSSAVWGDYDNDGDLDILLTGLPGVGYIYRNNIPVANTVPAVPSGLEALTGTGEVWFSWDPGSDGVTPEAGLSYNLRIASVDDTINAPMAEFPGGYRLLPAFGNSCQTTGWHLEADLPDGVYGWSVQIIDHTFAGSPFATEGSFLIGVLYPPQNLVILIAEDQLQLTWDSVLHAQSYRVLASAEAFGEFTDVTAEGVFEASETWVTTESEAASMFYQVVASTEPVE
jgi:hypothetical protein